MENFYEMANAAWPWIAIGLSIAIFAAAKANKKSTETENGTNTEKNVPDNYELIGLCGGYAIGMAIGHNTTAMLIGGMLGFMIFSQFKKEK